MAENLNKGGKASLNGKGSKKQNGNEQTFNTLVDTQTFFLKYKKIILSVLGVLVVLIVGGILYHNFVSVPNEEEASTALARGQEYFNAEQFDKALNGDGAGYAGFLSIASDYSSTDAGNLANLYAGLCYAQQQKPDWNKAVEYLEKYDGGSDMLISPAAEGALGDAYANTNQVDKAIKAFKKAADMANSQAEDGVNNSIAPRMLIKAGELLESQGKKDEALKIYQDVKKTYINSAAYQEIDKYIERASN